ncbi:MAG: ATP synthase F1 subunit gamma [Armatimonadota bacterium]|nr:ATP synthase F1 subunit gamma [Armatimonadota bacterium]MDW8107207.1 ATP synthase F1 subunit gamma [Armatimonadota bacterium]
MKTLRAMRARIRAARNIQQITRAMKLVSAARLRRAQDRVLAARPYAQRMHEMLQELGRAGELPEHPLLQKREPRTYGFVLATSDRGLCGAYNMNLIRTLQNTMRALNLTPEQVRLFCVGRRGYQYFSKRGYTVMLYRSMPTSGAGLEDARAVTSAIEQAFISGAVDRVMLIYSRFINPVTQRPVVLPLLPIEPPTGAEDGTKYDFIFEPSAEELLQRLLPRYLLTQVLQALLEASASEHGARMTAMSMATDNAGKMIQELTLVMNRIRQATITKEIAEVVGGAEALKG